MFSGSYPGYADKLILILPLQLQPPLQAPPDRVFDGTDHLRGNAADDAVVADPRDDGACGDHDVAADGHARQDRAVAAYPDVVSDIDRLHLSEVLTVFLRDSADDPPS